MPPVSEKRQTKSSKNRPEERVFSGLVRRLVKRRVFPVRLANHATSFDVSESRLAFGGNVKLVMPQVVFLCLWPFQRRAGTEFPWRNDWAFLATGLATNPKPSCTRYARRFIVH